MNEEHELRKKIDRWRRTLLIVHDSVSTATLNAFIAEAEQRLSEIEPAEAPAK